MVKLYGVSVLRRSEDTSTDGSASCVLLKSAFDLNSFGFFQRGSVGEFLAFASGMLVKRTSLGARTTIKENEYFCHVYVRNDGLSSVLISDAEYPNRVAHSLLTKVLDDVMAQTDNWKTATAETLKSYTGLEGFLSRYQNPREADAISKMQEDLDETKIIMHNTIEALLERGEKVDDLLAKSEELSLHTKLFLGNTKKMNSCCKF